jgi:hypothetical protein
MGLQRFTLFCLALVAITATGCGGNKNKYLRKAASVDLRCSEGQVHLSTLSRDDQRYLAEACGRRAVYTYTRETGAVRISEIEGANVAGVQGGEVVGPPPPGLNETPPPPPLPPPPPARP